VPSVRKTGVTQPSLLQMRKSGGILFSMSHIHVNLLRAPYRTMGSVSVALFLCVCVFSQMLGAPVTLASLLTSVDMLTESVSEEFSLPPTVPEPEAPRPLRVNMEFQPALHLPVLSASLFHPPRS
jgi:hypothetical protein